jgi:hypothetical protein
MNDHHHANLNTPVSPKPAAHGDEPVLLNKSEKLKRAFFQALIGSLLAAAAIAVVAVLIGSFSNTLGRALGTIAMVALHALLGFSHLNNTEKRDQKGDGRSIELFSNAVFALITVSFITSVFAIWQLLGSEVAARLYMFYGVLLFATFHADILYRVSGFEKKIDAIISTNYAVIVAAVLMLTTMIFYPDGSELGDFFYRLLAAVGIIDATLSITAIIMHKMYLQKHPEIAARVAKAASARSKNFWRHPIVVLLLIFLAFQVIGGVITLIMGAL